MSKYNGYQDEDEYRLPEGVQRVGYDADSQTYTYQSSDGTTFSGQPGNRYGKLVPMSQVGDTDGDEYKGRGNREAWRYMFPFFVLVVVFFLFLLITPLRKGNLGSKLRQACDGDSDVHTVGSGETCWKISEMFHTTVDQLQLQNPSLDCDHLQIGSAVCLPKLDV